jgi:serine/threonine-protein kinase
MSLYNELKRRNVLRVGAAYIVAAWLVIQVAETIFPLFGFDDTPARIVVIVLAIGFPLFLLFSWVFELTPEGLKRETEIDRAASTTHRTGKQLDRIIIVLLALALGYFAFDKFVLDPARDATELATATQEAHQEGRSEALVESYGDKSIAVLPFVNMSSDPEQEYFSDGISEELLNVLSKIPDLRVISRTSSFYFKGKDMKLVDIARELNVAHILEGSVRKTGNRVRITAQLINALSDTHLWSQTYDREILDMFVVQDEIATEIAAKLQLAIMGTAHTARPTDSEEAYDNFLRGMYFINEGWVAFLRARDYFKAAVEIDPTYAQAHALLALTYISLGNFRQLAPADVQQLASDAATTAIELDSRAPMAWIARGWLAMSYDFDWRSAETMFRRAIELAPSFYGGYNGLSMALQMAGRYEEALAAAQQAHSLDPLNFWTRNMLAEVSVQRREYDAALKHVEILLQMQPGDAENVSWIAWIYFLQNKPGEALLNAEKTMELAEGDPNLELGAAVVYAMLGKFSDAEEILARANVKIDSQFVSPGLIAIVYGYLGDSDQAFAWLERAVEVYDSFIFSLGYPVFDPIRSDPRFVELCARLQMACADQWDKDQN